MTINHTEDGSNSDGTTDQQKRREARVRALTAATLVLMVATILIAVSSVAWITLRSASQADQNGQELEAIAGVLVKVEDTNSRLLDCTEAGGKCFDDGQERTGAAVTGINEGTLLIISAALSCQEDGITEQRQLARCTARRAEAKSTTPTE